MRTKRRLKQVEEVSDEEEEEQPKKKKGRKGASKKDQDEDSDSDAEVFEADDGYGSDLYGDDEDRKWLDSLPAVQRESILFDRGEKRRQARERWEAQRKYKQQLEQKETPKGKSKTKPTKGKSKADSDEEESDRDESEPEESEVSDKESEVSDAESGQEDEDDDEDEGEEDEEEEVASPSSPKQDRKRSALEELKARRNNQIDTRRSEKFRGESEDEEGGHRSETEDDDGHASADEYPDEDAETKEFLVKGPPIPLDLDTVNSVLLRRVMLEKLAEEPYFDQYVRRKFVRIGIGMKGGVSVYRVAEVTGVVEVPRRYKLGNKETKKMLRLKIANYEKNFKMDMISNHSVSREEFDKWLEEMRKADCEVVSKQIALARKQAAEKLHKTFAYTPEVVESMVSAKRQSGLAGRNLALERTKLEHQRDAAQERGDTAAYEKCVHELDMLDELASKQKRKSMNPVAFGIRNINERNKLHNMSVDEIDAQEKAEKLKEAQKDAFARKPTRPAPIWSANAVKKADAKPAEDKSKKDAKQTKPATSKHDLDLDDILAHHIAEEEKTKALQHMETWKFMESAHAVPIAINLDSVSPLTAAYKNNLITSWHSGDKFHNSITIGEYRAKKQMLLQQQAAYAY
eukprot:TRINITY_DN15113_c0_g1_i1.p1 TRINITY_DN15113_c0_g1~~TRINITY_DN15113_c0_g1_i1.p1  ORF type:complete len:631 (-),score=187.00 TRINITY_DN15113_c0_g1_i1:62-1954(-)